MRRHDGAQEVGRYAVVVGRQQVAACCPGSKGRNVIAKAKAKL